MSSIPPLDVLVVENDRALAELLLRALHRAQLTTDVAGAVTEAKRLLARGSYKVLVLELILPDGTVMTESAALVLYIDGLVPDLGLVPPNPEGLRSHEVRIRYEAALQPM